LLVVDRVTRDRSGRRGAESVSGADAQGVEDLGKEKELVVQPPQPIFGEVIASFCEVELVFAKSVAADLLGPLEVGDRGQGKVGDADEEDGDRVRGNGEH